MIENFTLIIGAMKCGTTSLFALLSKHPQVAPSNPKELLFFGRDNRWAKGLEWYQGHWRWDPRIHRVAMEASTGYTKIPLFPNAAERIATVKANFRFIYVLRDPVDRIESHYAHQVHARRVPPPIPGKAKIHPQWVAVSKYAMQIAEYYRRFDAGRILLLAFEDLNNDGNHALIVADNRQGRVLFYKGGDMQKPFRRELTLRTEGWILKPVTCRSREPSLERAGEPTRAWAPASPIRLPRRSRVQRSRRQGEKANAATPADPTRLKGSSIRLTRPR